MVDTYSLITLDDLKSYAEVKNLDLEVDGLTVYGSDGTGATAKVNANVLTLVKSGGANPGTFTFNLTLAAYDTLTELAAAINLVSGWVASLQAAGTIGSVNLKTVPATTCLGTAEELTLKVYDNQMLEKQIDRASTMVENFLRRKIKSRDYVNERYNGNDDRELMIQNYPITKVERVCVGELDVISVMYDSTVPYNCFVRVTATGLEMWRDGAKDGDLAFAAYTTMDALVAAINAISGWEAVIGSSAYGTWPTTLLLQFQNRYCRASYADLSVPEEPVDDLDVLGEEGVILTTFAVPAGDKNVFVTYTGGYATVPGDIVLGCCMVTWELENRRRRDPSVASESLDDYSYVARKIEEVLGADAYAVLCRYRRPMSFIG